MPKRLPLASYETSGKPSKEEQRATVCGIDLMYVFEPGDPSVGLVDAYYVTAIKVGEKWLSADESFKPDFLDVLADEVGEMCRLNAEDDFDIPEAA